MKYEVVEDTEEDIEEELLECPVCGTLSLQITGNCEYCPVCGYSKCGV